MSGETIDESSLDILYLAACDWSAPWHGPQEIAVRLAGDGHRVTYVETLGRRRPRLRDLRRIASRMARGLGAGRLREPPPPGVTLVSPVLVPGARTRAERGLNRRLLERALRRAPGAAVPDVLWIYTPTPLAVDLAAHTRARLVLYHCTQSHRDRPGAPGDMDRLEGALMARAGVVVTDGIELYRERRGRHPDVVRIPSGVNPWPAGARPAPWLDALPRPVIGYLGSIDHRVDLGLIDALAVAHPEWSVVLVGPVGDAPVARLRERPNVTLHGQVPPAEVPGVLAGFDVAVMPYAPIPMTRYTYPAKLHQYLAAGLPIASTPLPDLDDVPGLAEIGEGRGGFTAAVERALSAPRDPERRRAVAARNTWEARYDELRRVVSGALSSRPAGVAG